MKSNPEIYARSMAVVMAILCNHDVPFDKRELWGGWQFLFPWCGGDVICHEGSYDSAEGYVESMGFPWDEDDVSVYSPEIMAGKIVRLWEKKRK